MKKLVITLLCSAPMFAQAPDYTTNTSSARSLQGGVLSLITRSAEKMNAENYSFKPTPEVRSFGQIIGHIADAQYLFCAPVLGEKKAPAPGVEKGKTTKAELLVALKTAFDYCDQAYKAITEPNASEKVSFFGGDRTNLSVLSFNTMHLYEHYGNLVTYMRLKGVVPPSSEPRKP